MRPRVLLLSAYDAASHRSWRESIVAGLGKYNWEVMTLPPRHFDWRVRGNALTWFSTDSRKLESGFDLLLATSMVDLAALRGLVPALAHTPALLYFHENQFAYPLSSDQSGGVEARMVSVYSAMCANHLLFNSEYNRNSFLSGVDAFLKKMPDGVPHDIGSELAPRSGVIPVPIKDVFFQQGERQIRSPGPMRIVWNHRWEYDKGPERLFPALKKLVDYGFEFEIFIIGQQFRRQPEIFAQFPELLGSHLRAFGHVDEGLYRQILRSCDIVLSTALHDFQGLAVLEGVASGCVPVVPDRLAYPELLPRRYRYESHIGDGEREAQVLADRLRSLRPPLQAPVVTGLNWETLAPKYIAIIDAFAGGT